MGQTETLIVPGSGVEKVVRFIDDGGPEPTADEAKEYFDFMVHLWVDRADELRKARAQGLEVDFREWGTACLIAETYYADHGDLGWNSAIRIESAMCERSRAMLCGIGGKDIQAQTEEQRLLIVARDQDALSRFDSLLSIIKPKKNELFRP